jgi:homocitrate synthase NifV
MALKFLYGVKTNVETKKLRSLSKLVSELSGVAVPPQKPIVGDDIFTVESGIIAGWWRRLEKRGVPLEMYPFLPRTVGHDGVSVVLGKKSGRDSILYVAQKHGLHLDDDTIDTLLSEVKKMAVAKKRPLEDDEFLALVRRSKGHGLKRAR